MPNAIQAAPVAPTQAPVDASAPVTAAPVDPVAVVEAPKEVAPEAPKLGAAYAKLAQQQRAAREAAEKLKAERVALEKEQAQLKAYQEAKDQAKRYPLKFLEQLGLSYQDLSEAMLNDGEPTPNLEVKAVRDELEQFKRQQDEARQQQLEAQRKQIEAEENQVIAQFQERCAQFVHSNPEKYELINTFGQADQIFNVISEHHAAQVAQGVPADKVQILSEEEAADAVEKYLEGQLDVVQKTKKFSAKAAPAATPAPTPAAKPKEQPTRSITNQLSPSTQAARPRALSMKEREKLAIETLKKGLGQ